MKKQAIAALATVLAASAALVAAPSADAAPSSTAARGAGTTSLAEVLAADGHRFDRHWGDFDILDAAVTAVLTAKPDSPVKVLADGSQPLTAFLPTDRAFRKLATALTGNRPRTEKGTFTRLAGLVDTDTLEAVLLYHVVPGATLDSGKVLKSDGAVLTTAQGGTLTVRVNGHRVRLVDADPNARNARVKPRLLDINKGNKQIAHGIDRVLRPIDL